MVKEDTQTTKKEEKRKIQWLPIILCVAILAIAIFVVSSTRKTNEELIQQTVKDFKEKVELPSQIDELTMLTDVTAKENAILYQYTVSSQTDTSVLSNDVIKDSLVENICKNNDIVDLLKKGIDLEYSYKVENSEQTYFVTFKYADCL
jgi:flagellar basal body-associated protein FliL